MYREREGSKNSGNPEGCRVLWTVDCLWEKRNTWDGASGGHVRAREGDT